MLQNVSFCGYLPLVQAKEVGNVVGLEGLLNATCIVGVGGLEKMANRIHRVFVTTNNEIP